MPFFYHFFCYVCYVGHVLSVPVIKLQLRTSLLCFPLCLSSFLRIPHSVHEDEHKLGKSLELLCLYERIRSCGISSEWALLW